MHKYTYEQGFIFPTTEQRNNFCFKLIKYCGIIKTICKEIPRPAPVHSAKLSFCLRRHENGRCPFFELSAKMIAGFRSPHLRLLSFRKESNQRFAKEEVSSLETPLRGTSPRELRKAKFSPPVCSVGKQMSGFAPATSGSRVPSSSVLTTDNMGVQRGANMTPFAGNPKTRRFLARLSSISSRQEMDPGVQGREATLQKRSCRDYPAITFLRGRLPKDGEPLTAASPSFRRPR